MASKNLVLLVVAHMPYIRRVEGDAPRSSENAALFEYVSGSLLPLLNSLRKIDGEFPEKKFRISIVLSPTLCEMLSDPELKRLYVEWLDARIAFGEAEVGRLSGNEERLKVARETLERARLDRIDFCEVLSMDILGAFSRLEQSGRIEFLATCAGFCYLPHYSDMPEVVGAQVEAGLLSHRNFFGSLPSGFYLPRLGYFGGISGILRSYGMNYSLVDSRSVLFSREEAERGIFSPVKCDKFSSLALFACDSTVEVAVRSFSEGPAYKSVASDVGFELTSSELSPFVAENSPRIPTGYRYESNSGGAYDSAGALSRAQSDARSFVDSKARMLDDAQRILGEDVSLVCAFDARDLGTDWSEGAAFFDSVLCEILGKRAEISLRGASDCLRRINSEGRQIQDLPPYPAAGMGDGFADCLLDSSNSWMVRYARKMGSRMVDIAGRFPTDTGLKVRLLNLAAKELLVAMDSELPKIVHDDEDGGGGAFGDFAGESFRESIRAFLVVYESLGSNKISTEWLTRVERNRPFFSWMNFRIFARKK